MVKNERLSDMRAFMRDVRTFASSQTPEVIDMIAGIKKLLDEPTDFRKAARIGSSRRSVG